LTALVLATPIALAQEAAAPYVPQTDAPAVLGRLKQTEINLGLDAGWQLTPSQNPQSAPSPGQAHSPAGNQPAGAKDEEQASQAANTSAGDEDAANEGTANEDAANDPAANNAGANDLDGDIIVVSSAYGPPDEDPLMRVNEAAFDFTDGLDQALVGPVADVYEDGLPSPIRIGLRNVLRNLREPVNFLNFLLQLKVGKAFETAGRFAINSTLGLGGIIDMAAKEGIGLPYRRNGFSNTLGFYGVGDGPFLVLPLAGATTLRDFIGAGLDQSVLPFVAGKPFNTPEYGVPAFVVNSLQFRIEFDETLTEIRESDDPYVALRDEYLGQRKAEVDALRNGDADAGIPGIDRFDRTQMLEEGALEAGPEAGSKAAPKTGPKAGSEVGAEANPGAMAKTPDLSEAAAVQQFTLPLRRCTAQEPCFLKPAASNNIRADVRRAAQIAALTRRRR
jgi:phospholipid-binding lipoprotein MlaA